MPGDMDLKRLLFDDWGVQSDSFDAQTTSSLTWRTVVAGKSM
jgi:hypothetical protein